MDDKCILDPQRDCLGLQKANMLEKQMDQWREQARSTHEKLFDRIRELEKAEAARNEQYESIMEKLDKLISWQESQQNAPAKQWNAIKSKVIVAVASSVLTAAILALISLIAPNL